jgi:hypothetical protein
LHVLNSNFLMFGNTALAFIHLALGFIMKLIYIYNSSITIEKTYEI